MTSPVELGGVRWPLLTTVALDRGPAIDLQITGVVRLGTYEVTPAVECDRLHVGDRLRGRYTNPAGQHGRARLQVRPITGRTFSTSNVAGSVATARPEPSDEPPIETWELDTVGMRPGAYTLSLQLVDPSPVGEARCYGSVSIAFSLAPRPVLPSTPRSNRSARGSH